MAHPAIILAIESSCDESAIAIYHKNLGVLSNKVFSQIPLHQVYGGVVPELAARDHLKRFPLLLKQALSESNLTLNDIDAIAYTAGPGLIGALMTGSIYAKSLAYSLKIPAIAIHHLEGHLLSPLLNQDKPNYPFLALLVSGGHTQLIAVNKVGDYKLLGQTLDDAVGEAFDKTAKMLGLPYPGGAHLADLAEKGNPNTYQLTKPMINRKGLDFSFSGLKTQVRLLIEQHKNQTNFSQIYADIAASFEKTIADTLSIKCKRAFDQTGFKDLVVAGGVSANKKLRTQLIDLAKKYNKRVFFPDLELCTDNALMIAFAASHRINQADKKLTVTIKSRWNLSDLNQITD